MDYKQEHSQSAQMSLQEARESLDISDYHIRQLLMTEDFPAFKMLERWWASHPTRDLDLSKGSFAAIADLDEGVIKVKARVIPPPTHIPPPPVMEGVNCGRLD